MGAAAFGNNMYTKFFGLAKRPFLLSPDPRFLYLSCAHDLAFSHLEYGLLQHAGFVALTGEVGAGKTTLLKYLFERVKRTLDIAMIFNTLMDPQTLLEMLLREFELTVPAGGKAAAVGTLYEHFMKQYGRGKRCVIIIDEAQNLSLESFEELRMLSNLEAGNDVLVQIILVGQPQLRARLAHPSLAQLTQRISVHFHLAPLAREEVGCYLAHRLHVAGYDRPEPLFTEEAVACVAEFSRGIPRVINTISDISLTYAFADEAAQVSPEIITRVVADNELLLACGRADAEPATPCVPDPPAPTASGNLAGAFPAPFDGLPGRLEALEARLRKLEEEGTHAALMVLRELLGEERKRTCQYAQALNALKLEHEKVQTLLDQLRRQLQGATGGEKPGNIRRIIGS